MSKQLLIVDDDLNWRMVVGAFLRRHGYETRFAADGPEALAKARAHRPHLIILDLAMLGMDTLEFLRAMRVVDGLATIPVIVTAARANPKGAGQAAAPGVRIHLVEAGESLRELLDAIRESLPDPL